LIFLSTFTSLGGQDIQNKEEEECVYILVSLDMLEFSKTKGCPSPSDDEE